MKKYDKKLTEEYMNTGEAPMRSEDPIGAFSGEYSEPVDEPVENVYIDSDDYIDDVEDYIDDTEDYIEEIPEVMSEWEEGYAEGYDAGYADASEPTDIIEPIESSFGVYESTKLDEATDIKKVINELIDTNWSGSNEEQMKAVQLLKGVATSDDPESNKFMKSLDKATSGMSKVE